MKKLSHLSVVAVVSLLLIFGITSVSFADPGDCSSAEIMMIGSAPGYGGAGSDGIKVSLKNKSGHTVGTDWNNNTERMFFLTDDLGDRGLAILLTAMSLDKPVWVRIAGNAEVNSLISVIFLNKQ